MTVKEGVIIYLQVVRLTCPLSIHIAGGIHTHMLRFLFSCFCKRLQKLSGDLPRILLWPTMALMHV